MATAYASATSRRLTFRRLHFRADGPTLIDEFIDGIAIHFSQGLTPRLHAWGTSEQGPPLSLSESTPDPELNPVVQGIDQAFEPDGATEADFSGLTLGCAAYKQVVRILCCACCLGRPTLIHQRVHIISLPRENHLFRTFTKLSSKTEGTTFLQLEQILTQLTTMRRESLREAQMAFRYRTRHGIRPYRPWWVRQHHSFFTIRAG